MVEMWTGSFFASSLQHDIKEFQNWPSVVSFPCRCDVCVALAHVHLVLPADSLGRNNHVDLGAPFSATYVLLLPAWVSPFQLCLTVYGCSQTHWTRDEFLDKLQPILARCVLGKGKRSRIFACGLGRRNLVFKVIDQLLGPFTSLRLERASFSKGFLRLSLFWRSQLQYLIYWKGVSHVCASFQRD